MAATITRSTKTKTKEKVKKGIKKSSSTSAKESKKSPSDLSAMLMLGSELLSSGRFNEGLPSFVTRGLDVEQIWQQLELRNEHKLGLVTSTRDAVKVEKGRPKKTEKSKKSRKKLLEEEKEDHENGEEEEFEGGGESDSGEDNDMLESIKKRLAKSGSDDDDEDDFDDFGKSDEEDEDKDDVDFDFELEREIAGLDDDDTDKSKKSRKKNAQKKVAKRTTIVDDKFFKLADMEEFLESEDAREERRKKKEEKKDNEDSDDESDEDDELIDMFGEEEEDNDPSSIAKYADFFDPPEGSAGKTAKAKDKTKKSKFDDVDESDEEEDEVEDEEEEEDMDMEGEDENEAAGSDDQEMEDEDDDDGDEDHDDDDGDEVGDTSEESEKKKKVSFSKNLFENDEDDKTMEKPKDVKSTFELKQEKLRQKAEEMEDLSLKDPSWELTGEASASKRPENSLLETVLDFQHTTKAAPVITDDTTKSLEDFIKQRIRDKTFDDVERKDKPKEDALEFKKRIVLDQEKSKLSLGELYEQEFLKQQQQDEDDVKADPECEAIEKDLNQLFKQLDALSNFRYTPMKPGTEVKILVNTPAISMEEVAPVATADAELLAPEEVHDKKRGDLKADDERDSTDKKRARRQKKKEKREKKKAKESREKLVEKMKPGLGNKYSKAKALKQLEQIAKQDKSVSMIQGERQKLGSSTSFFTQLQEEVQTNTKAKKASKEAKKKVKDASKLML